jgi:hypothetical protein
MIYTRAWKLCFKKRIHSTERQSHLSYQYIDLLTNEGKPFICNITDTQCDPPAPPLPHLRVACSCGGYTNQSGSRLKTSARLILKQICSSSYKQILEHLSSSLLHFDSNVRQIAFYFRKIKYILKTGSGTHSWIFNATSNRMKTVFVLFPC